MAARTRPGRLTHPVTPCHTTQVASGFLIELGNGDKFIFDLGSGSYVSTVQRTRYP